MSWKVLSRAVALARRRRRAVRRAGRGADPGAAEAERLPRRQRPRHDHRLQRIRGADRQAPGAAADLPPLGQQPQRGLRTLARNRRRGRSWRSRPPTTRRWRRSSPPSRSRSAPATTTCCSSTTSSPRTGCPPTSGRSGEPNRCLNVWSAVNCDGSQKGGEHTTGWYKQAFRRIAAIVRGGQTLEGINATLAEIGLPPLNRTKGPNPESLPAAPVSIIWSPLPGGSPRVKGQLPRQLLARQPLGRLGRHRLLLPVSRLGRPQPLLRRQAVEGQAGRDHRVGGLRRSTNRASSNS